MDSYVKDGQVYFNNGTSFRLCENFVKVKDDAVQRTVIVDLGSGSVEFRDLLGGKNSVYSNVTSGFRLGTKIPRVLPLLVWKNVTAMIDTWSGKWTMKFSGSDVFREVQKIENGIIHILSGEIIPILLKIKNPKYALTLEPHWGTISVYRKSDGHLYGRVSYDPRFKSINAREGNSVSANLVDSTGSPITNLDVTVSTQSPEKDTSVCKYTAAIDLTNGTIYLYDLKQRKIIIGSKVRDGTAYFKNGSSFKTCRTFVGFDNSESAITMVNLTTGDSFLLDRDNNTIIYKSNVYRGFPQKINSVRTIIAWNNIKVHIDTQSGDWIVQDPESGQFRKAKEIINGKVIMPDGKIISIQLKLSNKNYLLILEPLFGSIGIYRKSTGEIYGRILYNQGEKSDLYKCRTSINVHSTTTVVPLQGTEDFTEAALVDNPERALAEEVTTEDDLIEILKQLDITSFSDGFQNRTSSSEIDTATEIGITRDSERIADMKVFNLSAESSSSDNSTISSTLQTFFTDSGFNGKDIDAITNLVSEVEVKTSAPLDKYGRSAIETEETTAEAKQVVMEELNETKNSSTESIVENLEDSTREIEISFPDSIFENIHFAGVKVIEKQPEIRSDFTSVHDSGETTVTEVKSQLTEGVEGRDIASSNVGITEISQTNPGTNKEEVIPEELIAVSETLVTGTGVPFFEVTQHVQISEMTDSSIASSNTISYYTNDKISQMPSSEIQSSSTENISDNSDAAISYESGSVNTTLLKTALDRSTTQSENTKITGITVPLQSAFPSESDSMNSQQKKPPVLQEKASYGPADTTEDKITHNELNSINKSSTELPFLTLSSTEGSLLEPITNSSPAHMKDTFANWLDENLKADLNVPVPGSSNPEPVSVNVSMYTHTQDEQALEVGNDQISSKSGSEDTETVVALNTDAKFSTENLLTTSSPIGYAKEFVDRESKFVGEVDSEISSSAAQVSTEAHFETSGNRESEFQSIYPTTAPTSNITEGSDVSSGLTTEVTDITAFISISKEMESELSFKTGFATTEITKSKEYESPTSENGELTGSKSRKTTESNSSTGVNDTNNCESGAVESGSEGQDSSVERITTESDTSIKHDSDYITPVVITEEKVKVGLTNGFDHLGSTSTYLASETNRIENAEGTTAFEVTTTKDNLGTFTIKNGSSENGNTTEMMREFLSSASLESEESGVVQESELSSTDQETNEIITDSEIDSSLSLLLHTLLSTYDMFSEYFTSIVNADQVISATTIQSEDGETTEVTESFKSETRNTNLIPNKINTAESTSSIAVDELIASDNKQSPNSELDETTSTKDINASKYTEISSESQGSKVTPNGQETTTSIIGISKTLEGTSEPPSEIEVTIKTEKIISAQSESALTENASEISNTFEQEIDSYEPTMNVNSTVTSLDFTVTTAELPTMDVKKESESKAKYDNGILVLEKESPTPFGQTFTEVIDRRLPDNMKEMGIVQSQGSKTTENYFLAELSSLTKKSDLKSSDTLETEANADFANSTPSNVNSAESEINEYENSEKPIDRHSSVAITTLSTDKVFEEENEPRFSTTIDFSETKSALNEHKTVEENTTSSQSPIGEQEESGGIVDSIKSLLSAGEGEIDFTTESTEVLTAENGSSSEVVTSTSIVMAPTELIKEMSTKPNIERSPSGVSKDSDTSLTDSEMIGHTTREILTTSQPNLTEFINSSDIRAEMTKPPADLEQPCHSDTVTESPNDKIELGVISAETVKEVNVTNMFKESRSELSTEQSESMETTIKESPGTTTLVTDTEVAKLGNFSVSEIHKNDLTDTTNCEVTYSGEITTTSDVVFKTHESESSTLAFDEEETDPSAVLIKTTDPLNGTLRTKISLEVTESKTKTEDTSTSQDIKPSELISEEDIKSTVPVTNEPVKSVEFKSDTIINEFAIDEANTGQVSRVSEKIESQLIETGSTLDYLKKPDSFETRSVTLTIDDVSTDKIVLSSALNEVSKNEEISRGSSGDKTVGSVTNFENEQAKSEIMSNDDLSGLITKVADTGESDIAATTVSFTTEFNTKIASLSAEIAKFSPTVVFATQITEPHESIANERNQTTESTANANIELNAKVLFSEGVSSEISEIHSTEPGVDTISSTIKIDEKSNESATTMMSEGKSEGEASNIIIEGTVVVPSNISVVEGTNSTDIETDVVANISTTEPQGVSENKTLSESSVVTFIEYNTTFTPNITSVDVENNEGIFISNENESKLNEATEFDQTHSTTDSNCVGKRDTASPNINRSSTFASISDVSAVTNSETGIINGKSDVTNVSEENSKWTTISARNETTSVAGDSKKISFDTTESTALFTSTSNSDNLEKNTKEANAESNGNLGDSSSTMTTSLFKDFPVSGGESKVTETNNNLTLEAIIQSPTTGPIKSESEMIPSSEVDIIVPISTLITLGKSEETEESVARTDTPATEQGLKPGIVTAAVNVTEQPSDTLTFSSKEDVPDTTLFIEKTTNMKTVESSDSGSTYNIERETTDSNSILESVAITENIKTPTTENSYSISFNTEDANKLPSLSGESTKLSEKSNISTVSDGISATTDAAEESFSTTRSTVSVSADESTVNTERSKTTIIDDQTVVTREPKLDENIRSTAETDTIIENQELITESNKITIENISAIETGKIEVTATSDSESTVLEITQETSRNLKDIETTTAKVKVLTSSTDESRYEQSSSTKAIPTSDGLSTVFFGDRDGVFTVISNTERETDDTFTSENEVTGMQSSESNLISTSASAAENGTVGRISESDNAISSQTRGPAGVDYGPENTDSSIDAIENANSDSGFGSNEEESTNIPDSTTSESEVITDSKVTHIEDTKPAEDSVSNELIRITEANVIALSSDEKSTELEISSIENTVTSFYETKATHESTKTDEIVTSSSLTMASTTTAVPEESLRAISTVEKFGATETNSETVSTNIVKKPPNRTEEIENELISSTEPKTADYNLGETTSEDFGDRSTKPAATESGMVLPSSILYKSSESAEFELTSSKTSSSNYITQNIDLTPEVGIDTTKETLGIFNFISTTEAASNAEDLATAEPVSNTTEEKLPTNRGGLESEFNFSLEAVNSSEMAAVDMGDKSTETISTKSEIDVTSPLLRESTTRVTESMEVETINEKSLVSTKSTEVMPEAEEITIKGNSEFSKISSNPILSSMDSSTIVETEENLSGQSSISYISENLPTSPITTETDEVVSGESEKSIESSTVKEMGDTSISTVKTERLSSENSEISTEIGSLETDISSIEVTSQPSIITSLKMDEIVESIESSTVFSSEVRISSLETEYFSGSTDLSSAFSGSPTSSEEIIKSGTTSSENGMSSGTTDAESKISESNFETSEYESTSPMHEKQDIADNSVATSILPISVKTEKHVDTEQTTINELEGIDLHTDLNEIEDITAVYGNLSSSESWGQSSTTSEDGMESSQEGVETSEKGYTKTTWEASSESTRFIYTTEGTKMIMTDMVEPDVSTDVIDDGNKLPSLSGESTKLSEKSNISTVSDGISATTDAAEESFSTTRSTVSVSADESTVNTERSKTTIIDDQTVVTREPKLDENIRSTAETDTIIENQELITESNKITN
nr:hypothetical protein HmN_000464900 [Hymenolepis microstoma]